MKKAIAIIVLSLLWSNVAIAEAGCILGNCRDGQGTFTWANGDKYVGEWKGGLRHGRGTLTLANGAKYVGEHKDGKKSGQGTYTYPDGRIDIGRWWNDNLEKRTGGISRKKAKEKRKEKERIAEENRIKKIRAELVKKSYDLIPPKSELESAQNFLNILNQFMKKHPNIFDTVKITKFLISTKPILKNTFEEKQKNDLKLLKEFTNTSILFVSYLYNKNNDERINKLQEINLLYSKLDEYKKILLNNMSKSSYSISINATDKKMDISRIKMIERRLNKPIRSITKLKKFTYLIEQRIKYIKEEEERIRVKKKEEEERIAKDKKALSSELARTDDNIKKLKDFLRKTDINSSEELALSIIEYVEILENAYKERIYKHLVSANNNVDQFIYKEKKKKKEQERLAAGGLPDCVLKSSNKTDKLYILTFAPKECYLVEETNWSEDLIYKGELKNSKHHGKGIMNNKKLGIYEGEWKKGLMTEGKFSYLNGNIYTGKFKNNRLFKGTMVFENGLKYDGEWKDFKMHGKGTMIFSGKKKYIGEWKDGFMNGIGTMFLQNGDKYEGEWKDGKIHGLGTYTYYDGDIFRGNFTNNNFIDKKREEKLIKQRAEKEKQKRLNNPTYGLTKFGQQAWDIEQAKRCIRKTMGADRLIMLEYFEIVQEYLIKYASVTHNQKFHWREAWGWALKINEIGGCKTSRDFSSGGSGGISITPQ